MRTPASASASSGMSRRRNTSSRSKCALPQVTMPTVARGADDDVAVDRVDLRERAHRVELGVQALLDLQRRQVGPAVVQAVGGRDEAGLGVDVGAVLPGGDARVGLVEVDGRAALDHFRERREADPVAREARQRPAVEAELEVLGDVGRRQHRHVPRLHRRVALVRHRRRDAAVVVAGDDEDAAVRRRAVGVAVLERVAGAVDAGALAVPHREDAVGGALGVGLDALRAEHRGRGELLVDRGQELDAGGVEAAWPPSTPAGRPCRAASRGSR